MEYYDEENVRDPYTDETDDMFDTPGPEIISNSTSNSTGNFSTPHTTPLARRDGKSWWSVFWEIGVDSLHKKQNFWGPTSYSCDYNMVPTSYQYWYDDEGGFDIDNNRGWTIYIVEEGTGPWMTHEVRLALPRSGMSTDCARSNYRNSRTPSSTLPRLRL